MAFQCRAQDPAAPRDRSVGGRRHANTRSRRPAGRDGLPDLPEFELGLGLTMRPSVTTGGGMPAQDAAVDGKFQPSLDVTQRVGGNMLASLTANTDFAETEVDTRRTNLTRFPLFFPEKRTFFLEGADIFSFGLGLNQDVIPYFSRTDRSRRTAEVPIIAGGKINGRRRPDQRRRPGRRHQRQAAASSTTRRSWRSAGSSRICGASHGSAAIATVGDPLGAIRSSWLGGVDFTYATSHFRGDKNFLVGVWGLATDREDLGRDRTAHGFKIDYPNDMWDIALTYKRIGRDFDPSIGFVPRRGGAPLSTGRSTTARVSRRARCSNCFTNSSHRSRPTCADAGRAIASSWRRSTGVFAAAIVSSSTSTRPANA